MSKVIIVTLKPEKNERLERFIIPLDSVKFIAEEEDGTVFIGWKRSNLINRMLGYTGGMHIMENFDGIVRQLSNGKST